MTMLFRMFNMWRKEILIAISFIAFFLIALHILNNSVNEQAKNNIVNNVVEENKTTDNSNV